MLLGGLIYERGEFYAISLVATAYYVKTSNIAYLIVNRHAFYTES